MRDVVALGGLRGVDRLGDAAGVGHGQPASAVVLQLAAQGNALLPDDTSS